MELAFGSWVLLWDEMEQCFASLEIQQRVRDMQEELIELSNQSKERGLVCEVISTVAFADPMLLLWRKGASHI